MVAPNTLREHTTWSPAFSSAMHQQQDRAHAAARADAGLGALQRRQARAP
jgi:hypothetical protein